MLLGEATGVLLGALLLCDFLFVRDTLLLGEPAGILLRALLGSVTFFVGAPEQYINNVAFYAKLGFLLIAGLNAAAFEFFYAAAVKASTASDAPPAVYRAIAIVSIVSWFFVIYWGRMLPFIGNAF